MRSHVRTFSSDKTFNIEGCLKKGFETKSFAELSSSPVTALEGIGKKKAAVLESLNIKTVEDLAKWKFAHWAQALTVLADTEIESSQTSTAASIEFVLDKEYENKTFKDIVMADVAGIQGISAEKGSLLASTGVKTIADLGNWKYFARAKAIVTLAKAENLGNQIDIWN